ncbi:MFS transporter [Xanthobacter versatilis]|jgi:predicted MFS family arabinose efflux permease|uniref:MFS transporter n=1 Tax=Xanthobacter autotrophicus (strain ATCC BAA-1158 / Py2) TaxID=78245 RepID=UPI003727A6E0
MQSDAKVAWDRQYEWKAVALLSLGFGLVGIDRFMIMPMFPAIMKDLGLTYQDLGHITGILAIAWGISAFFMGNISDRIGRRKVVIGSLVIFSLLAGASGLAGGVGGLLLVRALMGFSEGAYAPASITATLEASKPTRHGLNLGIQQMAMPLFGLGLAPILVTQLLEIVDWRWIFLLVAAPGIVVAFLLYRLLRNVPRAAAALHTATHDASAHRWTDVFRYRNIPLNMVGMLCWLTTLVVTSALMPNYLTDHLHLDVQAMGFVLSGIGFGASLGTVLMPWLSDRLGRKPIMIVSVLGAMGFLLLLMGTGADPVWLFLFLFGAHFFNFALICLTVGPLSVEAVPAALMATASGIVIGTGEIFGGGVAPIIAGTVAHHFGIQYILHLAVGAMLVGFIVCTALKETAPRRARKDLVREPAPSPVNG